MGFAWMLKWILAVIIIIVGGLTLFFLACVLTLTAIMARWADHHERLDLCHVMEEHAQRQRRERKARRLQLLRERQYDWAGDDGLSRT
jgi:cell division protein FtsL